MKAIEPMIRRVFRLAGRQAGATHVLDEATRRSLCTRTHAKQIYSVDAPGAEAWDVNVANHTDRSTDPPTIEVSSLCGLCVEQLFHSRGAGWHGKSGYLADTQNRHLHARLRRRPRGTWLR